jgi:hypothetical protein
MDMLGTIDAFVRFNLSMSRWQAYGSSCETSVKKNCPFFATWNENFVFGIEEPEPILLELMDWDRTGTEIVGCATVSMEDVVKLMLSKRGSEIGLSLPVVNKEIPVMGNDNLPCCLNVIIRLIDDDRKIVTSPSPEKVRTFLEYSRVVILKEMPRMRGPFDEERL